MAELAEGEFRTTKSFAEVWQVLGGPFESESGSTRHYAGLQTLHVNGRPESGKPIKLVTLVSNSEQTGTLDKWYKSDDQTFGNIEFSWGGKNLHMGYKFQVRARGEETVVEFLFHRETLGMMNKLMEKVLTPGDDAHHDSMIQDLLTGIDPNGVVQFYPQ